MSSAVLGILEERAEDEISVLLVAILTARNKRILFIPDCHIPYHDKTAFRLVMRMAKKVRFDRICILGDFADFFKVSFHERTLEKRMGFGTEVAVVNDCLDEVDDLDAEDKNYVAGNHEFRFDRYMAEKAPELSDLPGLTVPELFRLEQRGWEWTPYRNETRIGKLWITHDEGTSGPMAAVRARGTYEGNVVIGHCHAMTTAYKGNAKGEVHGGFSFGWLGDVSKVDYLHQVKARQWVQGIGTGILEPNGVVHVKACPIIKGAVEVFGQVYR